LAAALASSDPSSALDVFGLNRTTEAVRAAISNQVFLVDSDAEFLGMEASVNGPLFELPGGLVRAALGYERQEHTGLPSLARGNPGTPSTCVPCGVAGVSDLQRDVNSFYAELLVPLVGADNALS